MTVILNDFRSVYNTAACFRTADGAGVEKIYLAGITPEPKDRFQRERKDFIKVSLGAEKSVKYEKTEDVFKLIDKLKNEAYLVVAIEQDKKSEDLFLFAKKCKESSLSRCKNYKDRIALIFGNEVEGLSKKILEKCDKIAEIPMRGKKESLNVSVAFGVAVFMLSNL